MAPGAARLPYHRPMGRSWQGRWWSVVARAMVCGAALTGLGLATAVWADGTRDCPSQLTGVGRALPSATPTGTCSLSPAGSDLVATLVVQEVSAAPCGRCLRVSSQGGRIEVRVAGVVGPLSGSRQEGDLLLGPAAWKALGASGPTSITWVSVACRGDQTIVLDATRPTGGPLRLVVREGRTGVAQVSLLGGAGVARQLVRGADNAFSTDAPAGDGPWRLRLTDVHGRSIETTVQRPGKGIETGQQFPGCVQIFDDGFEGGDLSAWGRESP